MTTSQYITVRETAQLLGISEKKVMDLVEGGKIQAYRIADQFLRLKKAEVVNLQTSGHVVAEIVQFKYTAAERVKDFLYFNDFYLLSVILISVLLYIILFL